MEINASDWVDNFHVFWREGKSGPGWTPDNCRLKVLDGGVLLLQERDREACHFYAPRTWTRIRVVPTVDPTG